MCLGVDELGLRRGISVRSGAPLRYGGAGVAADEPISYTEAVVGEVLAEEQVATAKRVKAELEESERLINAPRNFLTGWMWKSVSTSPLVPTPAAAAPPPPPSIPTTNAQAGSKDVETPVSPDNMTAPRSSSLS